MGGLHTTEVAYLLLIQNPWIRFLALLRTFLLMLLKFIDGTILNSGQRLDNVNQSHVVQASTTKNINFDSDMALAALHLQNPLLSNRWVRFLYCPRTKQ